MNKTIFPIFGMLLIVTMFCQSDTSAQNYTQWELPEGTIARLGKGRINDMRYSPDGAILAVATTIGIWIYDTETYQERALLAHNNKGVEKILFNPEGTVLASSERFKGITLWDVVSGKIKKTLPDGSSIYHILRFSPDGRTFASVDYKDIHLWDVATGKSKHILKKHTDFIQSLSFSPDGKMIASGSKDQTIRLWDVATGEFKKTLTGHPAPVTRISFSPNGSTLTSVSDDKTVYLWDTNAGKRIKTLANQGLISEQVEKQETIEKVFFSPDKKTLATVRFNNTIRLWDTTIGTLKQTFISQDTDIKQGDHLKKIENVLFSPDNRTVVSLIGSGKIRLWDIATGKRKHLAEYPGYVTNGTFSPDGKTLATGIFGGIIRIWDVDTGKHKKTITNLRARRDGPYDTNNMSLTPNGEKFTTCNSDGTIYLWNTNTKQRQPLAGEVYNHKDLPSRGVLFSPGGETLASWSLHEDKIIRLWDVESGKHKKTLRGHKALIKRVVFSPDSGTLASWSSYEERIIRLWDVATGKHRQTLTGHTDLVESVTFSPHGKTLASGGLDGTVRMWDAGTGKQIQVFTDKRLTNNQTQQLLAVTTVSFNLDGSVLASGHRNGPIYLWDVATGNLMQTFRGHADAISSVSFSSDGLTIASTSKDGTARLCDVATGKQKQSLTAYKKTIWHVKFYPNGLVLASDIKGEIGGVDDEIIRLWDLRTGELKKTLAGHASWVTGLLFSADGKTLSSLSFDDTVLLWDLTSIIQDLDVTE
ncbi:MAG: hypothetical protein OXI43_17595 [Candidatus Poribacteria bacterium]|nr:hypothetical protein [Candidatus Poribacteria bacterium]